MAELRPLPFGVLVERVFRELESRGSIFDLRKKSFFTNPEGLDLSVRFHGMRASTPYGPASGPQTQMAQNLVLAFLGGARIMELKTVQILDQLEIPRPCIDAPNLGFNVEWSQELRVEESLHEYVKGAMLIEMLIRSGKLGLRAADVDVIYDMSIGYDLKGIKSPSVQGFIAGMRDASELIERFRAEIPERYAALREIDFPTEISRSITISTFHGCPPDEVESIARYLLEEVGTHTIIKFNPTQLGPDRLRGILAERMGYPYHVPDKAFDDDMPLERGVGICERLHALASKRGLGFGAKFTNTLIVENASDFLPKSEAVIYLSGRPLHALSATLYDEYRQRFGGRLQYSFSAGIEAANFPASVALGLVPITVCTDLLKKGGYARGTKYLAGLAKEMKRLGATTIEDYIVAVRDERLAARGASSASSEAVAVRASSEATRGASAQTGGPSPVVAAMCENSAHYVATLFADRFYHRDELPKAPPKPGTRLEIFDCLTCDICIPVCPNQANFSYDLDRGSVPIRHYVYRAGLWQSEENGAVAVNKRHQIANFADFCNECGNCDVFCPDLGGPYVLKPRFFSSLEQWRQFSGHDGIYLADDGTHHRVYGRFEGREVFLEVDVAESGESTALPEALPVGRYRYGEVEVRLDPPRLLGDAPEGTTIDGTYIVLLDLLRRGVLFGAPVSYPALLARLSA